MKKVSCLFLLLCILLASCSNTLVTPSETDNMVDAVMTNIDIWEECDGKYCVVLQICELNGHYYLYCGYDETPIEHNSNAINRYSALFSYRYTVSENSFGGGEKTTMPTAADVMNGHNNLIGTSLYYYNDTYKEKYESVKKLLENIGNKN